MLEASNGDRRSYLEIAEVAEMNSPQPVADLAELYRRIVFSAMTANTDDHLRNHGFLRTNSGWRIAPAYDLKPNPDNPSHLTTAIDLDNGSCDLDLVISVAGYFRLSDADAKETAAEIEAATRDWRGHARKMGLPAADIDRMELAFDTDFRHQAARLGHTFARNPGPRPRIPNGRFTERR
jgi:serine/threonine-protein kinase HipA